ncbi:MAG: peptidase M15 [Prevotella sp.]|nr:peptidase M15 [Prevotella sp.]
MKTQQDWNEKLSEHFTLREFVVSRTAMVNNIDNTPTEEAVERLRQLCTHVLEPLRRRFGVIRVTSGYRCQELNRLVGGASNSQHLLGEAADLHVGSAETGRKMFVWMVGHTDFDQLLFEHAADGKARWLHVSYRADRPNRHQHDANYMAQSRNYCKVYIDKT